MPVTAKDIARELNLSQPTVSRILNGDRQHRISESTRKRVMETASRLEYQPNAVARSLRRGRTNVVGLYTNHNYDARNQFFGTVIGGLQRACEGHGLDLLLHSAYRKCTTHDVYGNLRDGRIDGLILHASPDDPLVERLGKSVLPVVAIADPVPHVPVVTCDDADGMRQIVHYLVGRGYTRFAFLAPRMHLGSVQRRQESFICELQRQGFKERDYSIIAIDFENVLPSMDELLRCGQGAAVCCWNDRTAYNLLHACIERGLRVPEEMAITGFDGFRDLSIPARQVVSIHCPWDRVAASALDLLMDMIKSVDSRSAAGVAEVSLPVELATGDTA